MNYHTANVITNLLWSSVLVFALWGFGWLIYTGEKQKHEHRMACIEMRGVITDKDECVPVVQK